MIVFDASLIIDAFIIPRRKKKDELLEKQLKRHQKAQKLMELIIAFKYPIYIPRVALVEITGILKRKLNFVPSEILNFILEYFETLDEAEIWTIARKIAELTGGRAIDSYYIATAKKTNSLLITADRIMATNAKKIGISTLLIK